VTPIRPVSRLLKLPLAAGQLYATIGLFTRTNARRLLSKAIHVGQALGRVAQSSVVYFLFRVPVTAAALWLIIDHETATAAFTTIRSASPEIAFGTLEIYLTAFFVAVAMTTHLIHTLIEASKIPRAARKALLATIIFLLLFCSVGVSAVN
jgi:glycerol uptake facilitator-like aquaporin